MLCSSQYDWLCSNKVSFLTASSLCSLVAWSKWIGKTKTQNNVTDLGWWNALQHPHCKTCLRRQLWALLPRGSCSLCPLDLWWPAKKIFVLGSRNKTHTCQRKGTLNGRAAHGPPQIWKDPAPQWFPSFPKLWKVSNFLHAVAVDLSNEAKQGFGPWQGTAPEGI